MDSSSIAQKLARVLGFDVPVITARLERPPSLDWGDVAYPCFDLAKEWRRSPRTIAIELAARLQHEAWSAAAVGGYVNFTWNREKVLYAELGQALRDGVVLPQLGQGKTIVLEFGSPNVAKPISMGNLLPTIMGHALARMYEAVGWSVIRINHLGDWGSQFGKVLAAYQRWGQDERIYQDPVNELFRLYVRFHGEVEADPQLDRDARTWFQRLEQGDPEAQRLWRWFVDESTTAFLATYARLGVTFDHVWGESFYTDHIPGMVHQLRQQGLLQTSEGADVVAIGDDVPPCLIIKSDGTTIYAARDIAAAIYRYERFHFDAMVYVVGAEQTLHFTQIFRILHQMGYAWAEHCHHVAFGLMRLEGRKMSSRRGEVVLLEDVLNEAQRRVTAIMDEKNPDLDEKAQIAEVVGVGAVVFHGLKNQRMRDVDFTWGDVLNFDGETGPYVQYTHARIQSLLDKAQFTPKDYFHQDTTTGEESPVTVWEWQLWTVLSGYGDVVAEAIERNEPFLVTRRLLVIAESFNSLYNKERILSDNVCERGKMLALTYHTGHVLRHGLELLGIGAPDRM